MRAKYMNMRVGMCFYTMNFRDQNALIYIGCVNYINTIVKLHMLRHFMTNPVGFAMTLLTHRRSM